MIELPRVRSGVVIDGDLVISLSRVAENLGGLFPDLENSVGNGSLRPSTNPVLPSRPKAHGLEQIAECSGSRNAGWRQSRHRNAGRFEDLAGED